MWVGVLLVQCVKQSSKLFVRECIASNVDSNKKGNISHNWVQLNCSLDKLSPKDQWSKMQASQHMPTFICTYDTAFQIKDHKYGNVQ